MDEFGVLVESIGFRAQGKSAPMAKLKPKPKSQFTTRNTSSFQDSHTLPVDELDGVFRSNVNISKQSQNTFVDDDIFGGPVSSSNQFGGVDLDSVFGSSNNVSNLNSRNSVGSNAYEDWLGTNSKQAFPVDDLLGTNSKKTYPADDLLGVFGRNSPVKQDKKVPEFDDLIPGFGGASPSKAEINSNANISRESSGRPSRSSSPVIDDPFLVFESTAHQSNASAHSSFDVFDDFIMGGAKSGSKVDTQRNTDKKPTSGRSSNGFVDDIFGGHQNNNAARPSSMGQNSLFGEFFDEAKEPEVKQTSSWSSSSTKKASSAANVGNDFSSLFGDVTTSSGEFQEIDGEPEERRRARLNRHMRTNARMAEALAEKNQRDIQSQREHEEKHRLAETLDNDIKRWATGKEGNLRALLSSLQQVLWPDCGWRPVSLTDMITSDSVKKAYKKATLYVHPDKVQQKGASLQQKYIAEKVFDLLKEAWNKFSAEELR